MTQTYSEIHQELKQIFESENSNGVVVNMESQSPLEVMDKNQMMEHMINPLTGDYYDGIYLMGEFASIGVLNNNNRKYIKSNYIELINILRKQIHGYGVYGETEHPKNRYPVDNTLVTHKLVDIWYDESTDKVMGIIVLLNFEGNRAIEIVKSGGKLALSARGGGVEHENNDGTITAELKLLVTFDIVGNPGFSTARQEYAGGADLGNISMYFPKGSKTKQSKGNRKTPIVVEYAEYQQLNESVQQKQQEKTSAAQQQKDAETLEKGDVKAQKELENQLSKQVDKSLNEGLQTLGNMASEHDKRKNGILMFTGAGTASDAPYDSSHVNSIMQSSEDEFNELMESFK